MSIFRSTEGENMLRNWCEQRVGRGPWDLRRTIETSLGPTHVAATGAGSTAVLWLPGTNFNAATSARLAETIGTRFRIYLADLPGQPGLSTSDRLGRDRVDLYGGWADEVVDELGEEAVIVVGHSLGAAVALAMTPTPTTLGVVLCSPAGLGRVRVTPTVLAVSARWQLRPSPQSSTALVSYMQHPSSPVDLELVEWLALVGRHTRQSGAPGPLPRSRLERWRDRAAVLVGTADRFFPPPRLEKAAASALNTTVRVVEGAGHLLPDEQPDAVLEAIEELPTTIR